MAFAWCVFVQIYDWQFLKVLANDIIGFVRAVIVDNKEFPICVLGNFQKCHRLQGFSELACTIPCADINADVHYVVFAAESG